MRRGFGESCEGRVGPYAFRASLLLLASPQLPALPLSLQQSGPYDSQLTALANDDTCLVSALVRCDRFQIDLKIYV